jgi:amidohydrolase
MTSALMALAARLRRAVDAELPTAVDLRRRIHAEPRLSGNETNSARMVAEHIGIPGRPAARTGRLIRVGPGTSPAVAVRAELDALPIVEQTAIAYAATNGAMHACGHDIHMAALAALARAARTLPLPHALLCVLQPREETSPSGAKDIVESGALAAEDARAIIAVHVQPRVAVGTVATGEGAINASADEFDLVVRGYGGHGAYPHTTRDPVLALAAVVLALQQVVARRVDPATSAVVTVGSVRAGTAPNVIPDVAEARGIIRVLVPRDRKPVQDLVTDVARHTARAWGCEAEVVIHPGEPVLENHPDLVRHTDPWLQRLNLGVGDALRSFGADDFAFYGQAVPSLMMFVGVTGGEPGEPGLHHPSFLPDDDAVRRTAYGMLAGYLGAIDFIATRSGMSA